MRRSWPYYAAVIIVGLLAGVAIAGRPSSEEKFILDPTATTAAPSTTAAAAPDETDPTDETEPADEADEAATTTEASEPDETDETTATTDADEATDTTDADTTVPGDATVLDRADVRVVLANGDGRSGLAGANATRLGTAGYTSIELTDVEDRPLTTVIFYRPGFEEESLNLRADLGTPNAFISVLTDPVTGIDDQGDLIVILGPDALR